MCPIVRSHFPLCGANDIHQNQTPPHAIKTTRATRPVQRRQAGSPPPPPCGSDSPHITPCGANEHPLRDLCATSVPSLVIAGVIVGVIAGVISPLHHPMMDT
eukprot:gene20393-biopygen8549